MTHAANSLDRALPTQSRAKAYIALTLLKRLGRKHSYNAQMINLLDYYLSFTKAQDWEEGSAPVVYQSLCKTAQHLGLSIRQIQRLEKRLFEAGLISWKDSTNNKRYGQRNREGRLIIAYGVDLSPLCAKIPDLEDAAQRKAIEEKIWNSLKKSVHQLRKELFQRSEINSMSLNADEEKALKDAIRHNIPSQLLQDFIAILTALKTRLFNCANVDKNVVHKKTTSSNNISNKLDRMGLNKITLDHVNAFSLRKGLGYKINNWDDLVKFAERKYGFLGISTHNWQNMVKSNGKICSALCVLLLFGGLNRQYNPVYNPKAYFSALIAIGQNDLLFLDKSIW